MLFHVVFLLICLCTAIETKKYHRFGDEKSEETLHPPQQRLLVDVDIYNRPYALPYFLRQLEDLKCPVIECLLDLHLYHVYQNDAENETMNFVRQWVKAMPRTQFSTITIDEWTAIDVDDRANRLGKTLQKSGALNATFLAMFDSMIVLLEPEKLLATLVSKDKPLMAPLLRSTKGVYSSTFYFDDQREDNFPRYRQIYEREKRGCFLLDGGIKDFYFFNFDHSAVRDAFRANIDMQMTEVYSVEQLAKKFNVPMYICNREVFGYLPAQYIEVMSDETILRELYFHMLIEHQLNGPSQTYLPAIRRTSLVPSAPPTTKTKFGFDEIYVINLLRRQDRRERLEATFDMLNISARFFEAVDGKLTIDQKYLENLNIRLLPDYEDPYNHRPMNYGELGCFFSHYFIWKDVVEKNYENGVLILEDDVRFDVYFKYKLERVFANRSFDWDLIYLGRKVMRPDEENVDEAFQTYLVKPSYSHWTVGYALSLRAAKILVAENPLQKILPVDEYLPIMMDQHPNLNWKSHFQNRTLKAFAFEPTIVSPTHYFGEPNYISDTENTTVLNATKIAKEIVSVDVVQTDNSVGVKDEL